MGLLRGLPSGNVRSGLGPVSKPLKSKQCLFCNFIVQCFNWNAHLSQALATGGQRESKGKKKKNLDRYECCKISTDAEWEMNMERAWEKITDSSFPFEALAAYKKWHQLHEMSEPVPMTKYSQNGNVSSCCCFLSRFYRFRPYWAELTIPSMEDVSPAVSFWLKCATKLSASVFREIFRL